MTWSSIFHPACVAIIGSLLATSSFAGERESGVDTNAVAKSARAVPSIYLTPEKREEVARTFVELVKLPSPSGKEEAIRAMLRDRLARLGGVEIGVGQEASGAPRNLVMEFRASNESSGKLGILLNAHMDTIAASTPEKLRFDAARDDFCHADEGSAGGRSSFGADDKAGIAVIVGCLSALKEGSWSTNAWHRRIVVALTASEEKGCVGARYLKEQHPEIFKDLEISLTFDGPIDFRSDYPAVSFVLVVSEADARQQPYRRVLDLAGELARRKNTRLDRTEIGLGMGDFAAFPATAQSGLHIRSPERGFHTRERVKLKDLIDHVDLLCHVLMEWDNEREVAPGRPQDGRTGKP